MKSILLVIFSVILLSSCSKIKGVEQISSGVDTLGGGWIKINIPDTTPIYDIYFKDNLTGYFAGPVQKKTIDGGLTWSTIHNHIATAIGGTADGKIFSSYRDSLFSSVNNGLNFRSTYFNDDLSFSHSYFTDQNNGFILAKKLYKTDNGGNSWNAIKDFSGICLGYNQGFFLDSSTGWVAFGVTAYRSSGSLSNWLPSNFNITPDATITSIDAVSSSIVYLCTLNGDLYKSTNGGANFTLRYRFSSTGGWEAKIKFFDANNGFVSHRNRIFKTTDGGISWQTVVYIENSLITNIYFTDINHGWACGYNGLLLRLN